MERRKKIVSKWLLYYPDYKAEYNTELNRIAHPQLKTDGLPRATNTKDVTGEKIAALVDGPESKWLKLVEDVTRDISPRMQIYLKLRQEYRHGRNWFIPIQQKYCYAVAELRGKEPEDCWVDRRSTFYLWWEDIINYGIVLASDRKIF
jgi:hypothetical protein